MGDASRLILLETSETKNAEFFSIDNLPKCSSEYWDNHHKEVIEDLKNFNGQLILK